jgi:hypothetical protein
MGKALLTGAVLVTLSMPASAGPEWSLLERGASVLGEARVWVEVCEAEQVGRFDGLLENVRQVLENAGLQEREIFRFEAAFEAGARLATGDSGPDCADAQPRTQVATGVQLVNQAIADTQ